MFFLFIQVNGQFDLNLKGVNIKSGEKVELLEIVVNTQGDSYVRIKTGEETVKIGKYDEIKEVKYYVNNIREFWINQAIKNNVYENLIKNGAQYDLRKGWEEEALKYLGELEAQDLIFDDNYLENYLYSLAYKIYPRSINDGRPGILNIKIIINNNPNAFIFPNGTMVLTSGLLSTIESEEELIGVMAHEVAHFVLDHSAININKAIQRQAVAEFWAAFATGLAAVADAYIATQNEYYTPGALTYSTAILSYTIANSFIDRLGLKYSQEQELAADKCAVELLKFHNIDSTALSSALSKIREICLINGNYYALTDEGTHPSIRSRIRTMGVPKQFISSDYDKLISFVNTTNAIIEFNNKHFDVCQKLVDRNIKANVATEDDYILKAMTNLNLYDNPPKNAESLELINKAKSLNVLPPLNMHKQEALVLIRLNRYSEAIIALEEYYKKLEQEFTRVEKYSWPLAMQYIESEIEWTVKMIHKVKNI